MENWQIDLIDSHIDLLIANTESKNTAMARSMTLYKILKTRKDSFECLMEALKATCQTGAFEILQSGLHDLPRKDKEIRSRAEKLLQLPIKFKGIKTTVKHILPSLSIDDAANILQNDDLVKELDKLKSGTVLELDAKLPELSPLYIPRRISNRVEIDPLIFKMACRDIFVIQGILREELVDLVGHNLVQQSTDQLTYITCRHILLNADEDWDDLIKIAAAPVHLISKESCGNQRDAFILIKSTELSSVLMRARKKDIKKTPDIYLGEREFIKKLRSIEDTQGACICDVPGMGKTWLLKSLMHGLTDEFPNDVVLFTSMSSLDEYLAVQETKLTLSVYLSIALGSKLAASLMLHYVSQKNVRLFMCLDGYDEININSLEKAAAFLKSMLNETKGRATIIITSRPHLRMELEKAFRLNAYDILPFDRAQQVQALTQQWRTTLPDHCLGKLREYAEHCVEETKHIKKKEDPDILGIPLKCYLLAVASEKRAGNYSNPNRKEPINLATDAVTTSVYGLYEEFVKNAFDRVSLSTRVSSMHNAEEWKEKMLCFHTWKALQLLFPGVAAEFVRIRPLEENNHEVNLLGVLSWNGSHFVFVHRSFAEFFAGHFFADLWPKAEQPIISRLLLSYKFPHKEVFCTKLLQTNIVRALKIYGFTMKDFPSVNARGFINNSVLWFMDRSLASDLRFLKYENIINFSATTTMQRMSHRVTEAFLYILPSNHIRKRFGQENLYCTLICCIRYRFRQIIRSLAQLIHRSNNLKKHLARIFISKSAMKTFPENEWKDLRNLEETSLCVMFLELARSGSEELFHDILDLFGDSETNLFRVILHRDNSDFPRRMLKVLLREVESNAHMTWFLTTLRDKKLVMEHDLPSPKLDTDTELVDEITKRIQRTSEVGHNREGLVELSYRLNQIKVMLSFFNIDSKNISLKLKAEVLAYAIYNCTENELFVILLTQFGKQGRTCGDIEELIKLNAINSSTVGDEGNIFPHFKAEDFLNKIAKCNLGIAFAMLGQTMDGMIFRHLKGVEILKVLLTVWKGMSIQQRKNWSYLHIAVSNGNADWVQYLLENGHGANPVDKYGNTPLLLIRPKSSLLLTKLLLSHGANAYHLNHWKLNVVHRVYNESDLVDKLRVIEWTNCMLDWGHYKLWTMENKRGKLPLDKLRQRFPKDDQLVKQIDSLLTNYEKKAITENHYEQT